jgi:dihydropteroate synthase
MPVLTEAMKLGCPVSLDTAKTEVMQRALELGVDIINDIQALRAPGALDCVSAHPSCGACLMHMQGEPRSMQAAPVYDDVLSTVKAFLSDRTGVLKDAGVGEDRIVLDPGYGFGKTMDHNLELFRRQRELLALGRPLLVGWSRKSTLGALTGRGPAERLIPSVAAALAAVQHGASIVRVHDVVATVDALKLWTVAGLA